MSAVTSEPQRSEIASALQRSPIVFTETPDLPPLMPPPAYATMDPATAAPAATSVTDSARTSTTANGGAARRPQPMPSYDPTVDVACHLALYALLIVLLAAVGAMVACEPIYVVNPSTSVVAIKAAADPPAAASDTAQDASHAITSAPRNHNTAKDARDASHAITSAPRNHNTAKDARVASQPSPAAAAVNKTAFVRYRAASIAYLDLDTGIMYRDADGQEPLPRHQQPSSTGNVVVAGGSLPSAVLHEKRAAVDRAELDQLIAQCDCAKFSSSSSSSPSSSSSSA
ncbi:hypothetical protein RI367_002434 [Sorochytrium milnesiophthora]